MADADPYLTVNTPAPVRRRGWRAWAIVAAVVLVVFGAIWWLTHRTSAADAAAGGYGGGASAGGGGRGGAGGAGKRPPATVGTAKVAVADLPVTLDALGTVTPPVTATVRARTSGILTQVLFTEGQTVQAGQLLAQVDPRPAEAALGQAQGTVEKDVAQLAQARSDLQRYQTLLKQDSIAAQQVQTQAALVKQLIGTVATDRAAVDAAKVNVDFTRVVAPVTGRVGLRQVDVGNTVTPADPNGVAIVTQVTPIDVLFTVPENVLNDLNHRTGVIPVDALDRNAGAILAHGRFTTLDNRVDTTTGTVRAKARFANTDGALFPNQFVNVRVTVSVLQNALIVPAAAIRTGPQGDFVYTVGDDRRARLSLIKRGPASGQSVAVLSGVQAGQLVVTEGADKLSDGARVLLAGDAHGGGPGGAGGHHHQGQAAS